MLIDTHCHLDAEEFASDHDAVVAAAQQAGIGLLVLPAVERANFGAVQALAVRYACCAPALGIHPMYVGRARPDDLDLLRLQLARGAAVAVGEIGLDYFVPRLDRDCQEYYFVAQLKLAREFDMPVLLHIRRAHDEVLKHLRRIRVPGGIAHAFNGSSQQAEEFIKLGFRLGFGGAMTWPRALRIRRLAATLPLDAIVLETDAPDMPPAWLGTGARNSPQELPRIGQVLARLRNEEEVAVMAATTRNALQALPRLAQLCT